MGKFMESQFAFAELPVEEQVEHVRNSTEASSYLNWMVGYICANCRPVKILLCRSEGTSYERFVHNMVEVEVEGTLRYMDALRGMGRNVLMYF